MVILDDDGEKVRNGDVILFSYGIPPVRVFGSVVILKRELWVLTPGHNPDRCRMAELRDHVGGFYKEQNAHVDLPPNGQPDCKKDASGG